MEMEQPMPPSPLGDGHTPATSSSASMEAMSSSLFWGDSAVVLFSDWPGTRGLGAYLLGLLLVLVFTVVVETLHAVSTYVAHRRRWRCCGFDVPVVVLTAAHAARMGAGYLFMLAVMFFNDGVCSF